RGVVHGFWRARASDVIDAGGAEVGDRPAGVNWVLDDAHDRTHLPAPAGRAGNAEVVELSGDGVLTLAVNVVAAINAANDFDQFRITHDHADALVPLFAVVVVI